MKLSLSLRAFSYEYFFWLASDAQYGQLENSVFCGDIIDDHFCFPYQKPTPLDVSYAPKLTAISMHRANFRFLCYLISWWAQIFSWMPLVTHWVLKPHHTCCLHSFLQRIRFFHSKHLKAFFSSLFSILKV